MFPEEYKLIKSEISRKRIPRFYSICFTLGLAQGKRVFPSFPMIMATQLLALKEDNNKIILIVSGLEQRSLMIVDVVVDEVDADCSQKFRSIR
ncbi:unnamed protein product [Leptidea sinapis]|uniref:Uncharacterized protein n=1 Tax=Leptidea sinapis TaxID=189913 RepID=A0A5E4QZ58_9NEOP|nr:unnamed protein product [Leptidea sinapis]